MFCSDVRCGSWKSRGGMSPHLGLQVASGLQADGGLCPVHLLACVVVSRGCRNGVPQARRLNSTRADPGIGVEARSMG